MERRHDEKFVGTVAAHEQPAFDGFPEQPGHGAERLIADEMAVRVVEQAEAVDIDQGHTEGRTLLPSALDFRGKHPDDGAVIECARQRIAAARLQQLERLAGEPPLGRPEDQVQGQGGDHRGRDGHDDHVAAELIEAPEDRPGVTPHPHDQDDLPIDHQREVFPQERLRLGLVGAAHIGRVAVHNRNLRLPLGDGPRELGAWLDDRARGRWVARCEHPPVGQAKLDQQDLALARERCHEALERRVLGRRHRRVVEQRGVEALMGEPTQRGQIALHDRAKARRRCVHADHDGLRRRRHADESEEHAEHDEEQDLSRRARTVTERRGQAPADCSHARQRTERCSFAPPNEGPFALPGPIGVRPGTGHPSRRPPPAAGGRAI